MTLRRAFYQKDIHNTSLYRNHRYFTETKTKTDTDSSHSHIFREFVELPQPFGVDYTYKYLRQANIKAIPVPKTQQSRFRSQRHSRRFDRNSTAKVWASGELLHSHNTEESRLEDPRKIKTITSEQGKERLPVDILLYEMLDNAKMHKVQLDIAKYIFGCFLRCQLKLEHMSLQQYRILSQYIPDALTYNREREPRKFIPQAELGFQRFKTVQEMLQRFIRFRDQGRHEEMYRLLLHYIIPQKQILDYQMGLLLNDIGSMVRRLSNEPVNPYYHLYIFNGNNMQQVSNIFELDCQQTIVVAQGSVDSRVVVKYRDTLSKRHRERKSNTTYIGTPQSHNRRNDSYKKLDMILQRRHKAKRGLSVKYHNPLLDIKMPFIDKSKLIRDNPLFQ